MNDEYRCTCGHAVYSHSTRDDTSHCLAIDCECDAYQADSYAAGVAAEKARVVAALKQQIKDTQERCRKLSEANSDEYLNVLSELDGLRRFSGHVSP